MIFTWTVVRFIRMDTKKRLADLDSELGDLTTEHETRVLSILEDRDKIILLQQHQIERLEAELKRVKAERDLLQIRLASCGTTTNVLEESETDTR